MSYLMRHACCCIAVSFLGIAFHRLSSLRFGKYQSELRSQHHQQQAKESIYANNFFDYENPHNVTRRLQGNYYFTATKYHLGELNFGATAGNPYKGLMGSPRYANYNHNANIPSSLEWNYVGLDVVMKGNPDVVGKENAFDWREMEKRLELAASRNKHVVFSMVIHYPGWEKLSVPKYLLDDGLKLYAYPDSTSSQYTPDYGDPLLLTAIEQFIKAFGHQYDGDQRIGFIHLGLLGFWVSFMSSRQWMIFSFLKSFLIN